MGNFVPESTLPPRPSSPPCPGLPQNLQLAFTAGEMRKSGEKHRYVGRELHGGILETPGNGSIRTEGEFWLYIVSNTLPFLSLRPCSKRLRVLGCQNLTGRDPDAIRLSHCKTKYQIPAEN